MTSDEQLHAHPELSPYRPLLAFAVLALAIALTAYYAFQRVESLIQSDKLGDLGAIADMKAAQIASWRAAHERLGKTFAHGSLVAIEFSKWLQEGAPHNERARRLDKILAELREVSRYKTLALLDTRGEVRVSAGISPELGVEETRLALQAMERREVAFFDLHRNSYGDKSISIDVIAPLVTGESGSGRVAGAAVLQVDPSRFLYPLIQSWPTPSPSAETHLVRLDGDDVLYLNEPRHKKGMALALRSSVTTAKLPAAMALRGELSTTDGIDYRGVPVVSEMRPVPGSPWFVVCQVDRDELFAPIHHVKDWSAGLGMTYVLAGGLLVFVWFRGHKAQYRYLQTQRDAAVERAMLVKHFEYLTRHANDIILVADWGGHIVEANERALEAYGYSREEMLGKTIFDFRDPAEDPSVFAQLAKRFRAKGELVYETTELRRNGTTFPAEVSARLIEVEGVRYVQGIIRDISERKRGEEALRRSEAMLKGSQQMAHMGSWELDLVNDVLYWSDENYRIFEADRDAFEASYEAFLALVHPDDRALVDRIYTDSVNNRTPYTVVHRLLFPDGRVKFLREWCETIYDGSGRPIRSIGTTQDITEHQLAQNALRKSAEEVEDLYDHAPCGYHSLDADGTIIKINDTELSWLGYARHEVVNRMNFAELLSPASRNFFQVNYATFKQAGVIRDVEYELVRRDGTTLPVVLNATAIYDSSGRYVMSRSTVFDITVRKSVEKKLGESEERFRTMADNAPIMIWMEDARDGSASACSNYFNQRWHEFTGLTEERSRGCEWQESIHPDDRKLYLDGYQAAFEKREPFKMEYRLRRHDDVYRWVEDSGVPRFTADKEFLGYIGICIDVTEHKLFERIRVDMQHMDRLNIAGEMASGLAHELSQPLTAAGNYLDVCLRRMAESTWDTVALQKTVALAHDQTERAAKIIGHLKALVRKQEFERTMLDVNSVIEDAVKFLGYELKHHYISVTQDISRLPPVLANRIEIEQVLINLIKNAIDSMSASPRRDLRIATRVIESGTVLVTVSDTGKGIGAEDMDAIFNPFHTSKADGLGLGLAICRSLIENYGGHIWAEQKDDAGVEFNFTLPGEATL